MGISIRHPQLKDRHYRFGVVAQFFNVAAQTCTWIFTIQYVQEAIGGDEANAGRYLQYSLMVFLVSRFFMTWALGYVRPARLLMAMAILGGALMPLVQGALIDRFDAATSYITPAACFLIVAAYGWFDLSSATRKGIVHP